jgi:hypothetical protein
VRRHAKELRGNARGHSGLPLIAGTLVGSVAVVYVIGIALAVPSWWSLLRALRAFATLRSPTTLWLNGWMVATLVVLGLPL